MRIHRAFAVAQAEDAAAGLALLEDTPVLEGYPYFFLIRATLRARDGQREGAEVDFARAAELARNAHEAQEIRAQRDALLTGS